MSIDSAIMFRSCQNEQPRFFDVSQASELQNPTIETQNNFSREPVESPDGPPMVSIEISNNENVFNEALDHFK